MKSSFKRLTNRATPAERIGVRYKHAAGGKNPDQVEIVVPPVCPVRDIAARRIARGCMRILVFHPRVLWVGGINIWVRNYLEVIL